MSPDEACQTLQLMATMVVMGLGVAFMVGGPKLAKKYCVWFRDGALGILVWVIKLPFQILGRLVFGKKKKKKKKKRS